MSHSFSFNRVHLGQYGLLVVQPPMPYLAAPRLEVEELTGVDGAAVAGATRGPRWFRLTCLVQHADAPTRIAYLQAVVDVLEASFEGECPLEFDCWPGRRWQARLASGVEARPTARGLEFDLEFVAPDPQHEEV